MITFSRECERLLKELKKKSPETYYHSFRVKKLTFSMLNYINSQQTRFDQKEIDTFCKGALFHDIGKLQIRNYLLTKPTKLTDDEMAEMRLHTVYGGEALRNAVGEEEAQGILDICLRHHERVDTQTEDRKIPLHVQVVSICDAYDALRSDRVYHKGIPREDALRIIESGGCGAFSDYMLSCLNAVAAKEMS